MEKKYRGEFIRPDGVSSGKVDIYLSETKRRPDEIGLSDVTGWAGVSDKFATVSLIGDSACDLHLEDGRVIPVLIAGGEIGNRTTITFTRR